MKRAAKCYPLYAGAEPQTGRDQYLGVIPYELRSKAAMWWTFGGVVRSVQLPASKGQGGELIKLLAGWSGVESDAQVVAYAQEVRDACGTRCVTGFGGAVRASLGNVLPVESRTHTAPFLGLIRGGWQAALKPGNHSGVWYQYDLRSAYYGALLAGLPDPRSFRVTRVLGPAGVFRVRLGEGGRKGLPYPFDLESEVIASWDEIQTYGLPVAEVITGVRWTRDYDTRPIIHACDRWTFAKAARRSFWGTWASDQGVVCHSASGSAWSPLAPRPHPIWAHLILSRVRCQVWQDSGRACHVFVDSLITRDRLRTGDGPGEWKHVQTYESGVRVGGAGQYGPSRGPWDRWAGVSATDGRRMVA